MAITVGNCQVNSVTAAASTGITVTKPTGLADGDVLYAFISKTTYANTNNFTCTDWVDLSPATDGITTGNDRHSNILRKVITNAAGEAANYTFLVSGNATSSQMCGMIVALAGVDTTTPEDITVPAYTFTENNSAAATVDGTSATAGALAIAYLQISLATTAPLTPAAPANYDLVTGGTTSETAGGNLDNQVVIASKTLGAAGSTVGTDAWTHVDNNADSLSALVLVRPLITVVSPLPPAVVKSQAQERTQLGRTVAQRARVAPPNLTAPVVLPPVPMRIVM